MILNISLLQFTHPKYDIKSKYDVSRIVTHKKYIKSWNMKGTILKNT